MYFILMFSPPCLLKCCFFIILRFLVSGCCAFFCFCLKLISCFSVCVALELLYVLPCILLIIILVFAPPPLFIGCAFFGFCLLRLFLVIYISVFLMCLISSVLLIMNSCLLHHPMLHVVSPPSPPPQRPSYAVFHPRQAFFCRGE